MARIDPRDRHQKKGLQWFFGELKKATKDINYNAFNPIKDPFIGGVFMYRYDAKWKEKLPIWDRLPLVIPFDIYPGGFIGLNLHYATAAERKIILTYLLNLKQKKTNRQYISISYQAIKSAIKSGAYKPCIHRYLNSHIRSRLVKIDMEELENIASLPLAQWQKKNI